VKLITSIFFDDLQLGLLALFGLFGLFGRT
jgi:hypothetical protein